MVFFQLFSLVFSSFVVFVNFLDILSAFTMIGLLEEIWMNCDDGLPKAIPEQESRLIF